MSGTWRLSIILSLALGSSLLSRAAADTPPTHLVAPAATRVLLLPAIDTTSDAKNMLEPRRAIIRHRVQFEFLTRQFELIGEAAAAAAAATSPSIDLDSDTARTDVILDELGQRSGADWVVSAVVQHVEASSSPGGGLIIRSRIRFQIRDARRHHWIVDRDYTDETVVVASPVMGFLHSLNGAVRKPLTDALRDYPIVVLLQDEDSLRDYLAMSLPK